MSTPETEGSRSPENVNFKKPEHGESTPTNVDKKEGSINAFEKERGDLGPFLDMDEYSESTSPDTTLDTAAKKRDEYIKGVLEQRDAGVPSDQIELGDAFGQDIYEEYSDEIGASIDKRDEYEIYHDEVSGDPEGQKRKMDAMIKKRDRFVDNSKQGTEWAIAKAREKLQ